MFQHLENRRLQQISRLLGNSYIFAFCVCCFIPEGVVLEVFVPFLVGVLARMWYSTISLLGRLYFWLFVCAVFNFRPWSFVDAKIIMMCKIIPSFTTILLEQSSRLTRHSHPFALRQTHTAAFPSSTIDWTRLPAITSQCHL